MTVLIIEGPDLAGKGFAIEKIAKSFRDGFLIKNLYKPRDAGDSKIYEQYWRIMTIHADYKDMFLILDRFFPSQAVYSYKRGEDEMDSEQIEELDTECAKAGFIYIYLDTPLDILEKRFDERGDEHITKDELQELHKRYEIFYNKTKMRKIRVNTLEKDWLLNLGEFVLEAESNGTDEYY